VRAALAAFHAENPDLTGTGLERLRLQTAPRVPAPVFRAILRGFVGAGWLVIDGNWVRLASHQVAISLEEENLWFELGRHISGGERFRPPRVRDIARLTGEDEGDIRRLFKRLGRAGEIDEVAHDHFFLRRTVAEAVDIACAVELAANGWFNAALYRDAVEAAGGGTVGRKVAIQILEFFDRHGVTIRRGDQRRVNPHRRDLFAVASEHAKTQDVDGSGREASLVGRPDFKSGWGRETVSGGFDSHSLPPLPGGAARAGIG
jgi:selenocysteine-specific elongation factor